MIPAKISCIDCPEGHASCSIACSSTSRRPCRTSPAQMPGLSYGERCALGMHQGSTAPWNPSGAELLAPACSNTAGGQPPAFLHICTSLRHAVGAGPLLAVCPQWAAPRFSEAPSNPAMHPDPLQDMCTLVMLYSQGGFKQLLHMVHRFPNTPQSPPPCSPCCTVRGSLKQLLHMVRRFFRTPQSPASIPAYCKLAQILLVLPFGQPAASLDQACMDTLRTSSSTPEGLSQPQLVAAMRIRCSPPRPERVLAHWQRYMANPS